MLLVQTKFTIPPLRPVPVSRPRLTGRIDEGLRGKLTLISAQAGSGKTTLAVEWLNVIEDRAAWLSLDESDNDPNRFLAYVIAAIQTVNAELGQAVLPLLFSMRPPPLESLFSLLINDLLRETEPIILVLDDYHVLRERTIHEAFAFFLERLPTKVHLVMITREDPMLPLHQLRARGQLTEIRGRDLRFTQEETFQFLNQTMGLALGLEDTESLMRRTEGWVAGLQLAALSLRGLDHTGDFITRFSGDDRYLVEYLVTEVLERQVPEVREFLLRTAVLNRLSVSLCNAVTGQTNSRAILNHLEKANLFLVALDNRREWYRYHRLLDIP